MGSSRLRKAIGAVKDQASISLAKVASNASLSELRVAIVKATGHKACPPKEHHIQEILSLTCYSRQHAASCVRTISRRLGKTKDWVVALKALILLNRLLQEGNPAYQQEVFFVTKNGRHLLNMSDFCDTAWANSWDFSAFVQMYALFLDEQLDYRIQRRRGRHGVFLHEQEDEDEDLNHGNLVVKTTPVHEMQNSQVYSQTKRLMTLVDRFLACRPTGPARYHGLVMFALHPIVKQSFELYYELTEIMDVLIDRFAELEIMEAMKVFEIICRVAKQYDELDAFYCWCNEACIARSSDYPEVYKISEKKLNVMDEFIKAKIEIGQNPQDDESRPNNEEPKQLEPEPTPEREPDPDMNAIKALPGPPEEDKKEVKKTQEIGDLLNLEDDASSPEDHSDKLALALFGSDPMATDSAKTKTHSWEAFDESGDWETALVQTASQLSNQQPSLPRGFNTLVLDGLYQQATMVNLGLTTATGSASSVAVGSTGRPTTLALPAPPAAPAGGDPFAASLAVAPPSFVQMSDMEKSQRLLVEEQMMCQQYYQGQVGSQQYPYNMVGYT